MTRDENKACFEVLNATREGDRLCDIRHQGSDEAILVIGSDYRVVMMNAAARDLYAIDSGRFAVSRCHQLLHSREEPCDLTETACGLQLARETEKTVTIKHEHQVSDGARRIVEFLAYPLWRPDGHFAGIVEIVRDVTDQKQLHHLVYRAKKEWEAALDAVSDLVFLTDLEGRVVRCNRSMTKRLQRSFKEILGQDIRHLFCVESSTRSSFFEEEHGELGLDTPRGTFEFERFAVHLEGSHFGFVFVFRDVTQLRRLESIAASVDMMNNLGHVLSAVRHEIGNPLNAIKTALTVLQESFDWFDDDRKRTYLARCLHDVSRMQELIEQLRTFNMFEEIVLKRMDIVAFVNQCVARLDSDLRIRGIAFESTIRDQGPVQILADQRALQHIVLGLVANAAEAVGQRQDATIALDFVASDREVRMSISDNGVGIEDDQLDKVFLPLFTTKPKGTGLGLAIARNLITKMNGTIELWSAVGQGTKVEISLPRVLPTAVGEEAITREG